MVRFLGESKVSEHLHLGHLAVDFIQSDLKYVYLSEERNILSRLKKKLTRSKKILKTDKTFLNVKVSAKILKSG